MSGGGGGMGGGRLYVTASIQLLLVTCMHRSNLVKASIHLFLVCIRATWSKQAFSCFLYGYEQPGQSKRSVVSCMDTSNLVKACVQLFLVICTQVAQFLSDTV